MLSTNVKFLRRILFAVDLFIIVGLCFAVCGLSGEDDPMFTAVYFSIVLIFLFSLFERITDFEHWPGKGMAWRHIYLLLVVNFGWVLFRADNLYCFAEYAANMFMLNGNGFFSDAALMFLRENWLWFVLAVLACIPPEILYKRAERVMEKLHLKMPKLSALYPPAMLALFSVCVIYVVRSDYNPFIYFNF